MLQRRSCGSSPELRIRRGNAGRPPIRLVELRARVPRYQRELARREETSVDALLARELEDVTSAHAKELASALPGLGAEMA